jgi:amidophosphoribosyltransferase
MIKENCGIAATYLKETFNAPFILYQALIALQHRGQESCGISTLVNNNLIIKKYMGLVTQCFNENVLNELKSKLGIAHVRYSTTGKSAIEDAQPFLFKEGNFEMALAFNGNIVNLIELRKKVKEKGYNFVGNGDGELLTALVFFAIKESKDIEEAVKKIMEEVEGAYSAVMMTNEGQVIAFRDPIGFRPLIISFNKNGDALLASETVAADINDFNEIQTVNPGELIIIDGEKIERKKIIQNNHQHFCMFELVYFSRPDSIYEGKSVYEIRYRLGQELARTYKTDADIIVPIPDTSRPAAEAISRETGIPVVEGLIKNRYIGRTFIMPSQKERERTVKLKLNPIKPLIKDKKVLLIDDSIVRGTTIKNIIEIIRKAGAKKVEVWITCPPIISPCFYGIDIAIHGELIASNKKVEEIAKEIGADRLCYQTLEGLIRATGMEERLCLSCLTGIYPTPLAQRLANMLKDKKIQQRYWEVDVAQIL